MFNERVLANEITAAVTALRSDAVANAAAFAKLTEHPEGSAEHAVVVTVLAELDVKPTEIGRWHQVYHTALDISALAAAGSEPEPLID